MEDGSALKEKQKLVYLLFWHNKVNVEIEIQQQELRKMLFKK